MWFEKNFIRELEELQGAMDQFLKEKEEEYSLGAIPANIYENKDNVFVIMPVAGIPKENIEINYQNKTLFVKAKKEADIKDVKRILRKERKTGEFVRNIQIEQTVDSEKIKAKYQHGFLIVELTKKEEAKSKKVKID